jgi:hypothetical protein
MVSVSECLARTRWEMFKLRVKCSAVHNKGAPQLQAERHLRAQLSYVHKCLTCIATEGGERTTVRSTPACASGSSGLPNMASVSECPARTELLMFELSVRYRAVGNRGPRAPIGAMLARKACTSACVRGALGCIRRDMPSDHFTALAVRSGNHKMPPAVNEGLSSSATALTAVNKSGICTDSYYFCLCCLGVGGSCTAVLPACLGYLALKS